MAVYTKLDDSEIAELISNYEVGNFASANGIEEGIENSNYLVKTNEESLILTIFEERVENFELPFFISLTDHLISKNINCPKTLTDKSGNRLQDINGKKAALISFLPGRPAAKPTTEHIKEVGFLSAKLHSAVEDFDETRKNPLALGAWTKLFEKCGDRIDEIKPGLTKSLANELYYLANNWPFDLPSGIIHADLFPDNLFFQNNKVSGVIDFYFACTDYFAYDIAICINAWGIEEDQEKINALLESYQSIRPLSEEEKQAMPVLLRGAALRFLLTRIYDWFNTPENALVTKKDPQEYLKKLEFWQKNPFSY